ncbi:MAG: hypothetical protein Q8O95_03205 [bacterium]|nr:hypothetical protein [bacterium]
MLKTITSKELRSRFPWVQEQLANGIRFIVICRSQPVGVLNPFDFSQLRGGGAQEEGLSQEEYQHWLSMSEQSFDFWNDPSNDAYDQLTEKNTDAKG